MKMLFTIREIDIIVEDIIDNITPEVIRMKTIIEDIMDTITGDIDIK